MNPCHKVQGKKSPKEKKKVPGWSIEEMKEKPNIAVEEDTEEMRKWRGLSQSEMDQCWRNLAENGRGSPGQVQGRKKQKRDPLEWRRVRKNKKYKIRKWREDCWVRFSLCLENNLQRLLSKQDESTEEEEMQQQQILAVMKDLIKKVRSKGRMDARNRWWVTEILATDCEKAWIHTGWEDTMQKWYEWLEYVMRKDEKEKWRRCISARWRR